MTENIEELRREMHQMLTASDREMKLIEENARLRGALRNIACNEGTCGCAFTKIENADCFHGIARAALGEGEE
jgi:hypothetical protein